MPWSKTPESRRHDAETYGSAEYLRNRAIARRRANGRCEGCQHRHDRLQCDHDTPVSHGGTHHPDNLKMLCSGTGTCRCHERKTAQEGGGYRIVTAAPDPELQARTDW